MAQWLAYLLLDPDASGSIPGIPNIFQMKKIANFADAIHNAANRKVDSGLKTLIKPINYTISFSFKNLVWRHLTQEKKER